jgi:DNA modification methylase
LDSSSPRLAFSSDTPFVRLYHGNCLELLDAIFADPPYFFSNPESFRDCQRVLKPNGTIWQN